LIKEMILMEANLEQDNKNDSRDSIFTFTFSTAPASIAFYCSCAMYVLLLIDFSICVLTLVVITSIDIVAVTTELWKMF
jgi:hypothetical protein